MTQQEKGKFTKDCNSWRTELRQFREQLSEYSERLHQRAGQPFSKAELMKVEHLHNQLHIQLINIHDLRHAIKSHERKVESELNNNKGVIKENTIACHEMLHGQRQQLLVLLKEVQQECSEFLPKADAVF